MKKCLNQEATQVKEIVKPKLCAIVKPDDTSKPFKGVGIFSDEEISDYREKGYNVIFL